VIGIYPETKLPTYHKSIGLPLEKRLVDTLARAGWNRRDAPVFIQSFEQSSLKELRKMTPIRLIQLVDANDVNPDGSLDFTAPFDRPFDWTASGDPRLLARTFGFFVTDAGLRESKTYADGIGPWKRYIVSSVPVPARTAPGEASRRALAPTDLIERAHKSDSLIHTWTFRNEQRRLLSDYAFFKAKNPTWSISRPVGLALSQRWQHWRAGSARIRKSNRSHSSARRHTCDVSECVAALSSPAA